jgi:hypothetical protein
MDDKVPMAIRPSRAALRRLSFLERKSRASRRCTTLSTRTHSSVCFDAGRAALLARRCVRRVPGMADDFPSCSERADMGLAVTFASGREYNVNG